MPFPKGETRWSIQYDRFQVQDMAALLHCQCTTAEQFKDVILPMGMEKLDYNDIMHVKTRKTLS